MLEVVQSYHMSNAVLNGLRKTNRIINYVAFLQGAHLDEQIMCTQNMHINDDINHERTKDIRTFVKWQHSSNKITPTNAPHPGCASESSVVVSKN